MRFQVLTEARMKMAVFWDVAHDEGSDDGDSKLL
jgi:hypothetical protein